MGVNVNGEEVLVVHGELKAVDLQEGCYPYTLHVDWGVAAIPLPQCDLRQCRV